MEDWAKLAEEAVKRGCNPDFAAKLAVEADIPIFPWLVGQERVEAINHRAYARDTLEHLVRETPSCFCTFAMHATEEELVALYKNITGHEPEPGRVNAMKGECKLEGIEFRPAIPLSGSDPNVTRLYLEDDPTRINKDLTQSIKEEQQAENAYTDRATAAEFFGDYQTRALYEHVIQEERQHKEEFQKRLNEKANED